MTFYLGENGSVTCNETCDESQISLLALALSEELHLQRELDLTPVVFRNLNLNIFQKLV